MSADHAAYEPFPAFDSWGVDFDANTIERFAALLDEARQRATPEAQAAAVTLATRYAAVDTGAIEGLYETNRDFTRTIAEQTSTWQAALAGRGEHVARSIQDALNGYEMVLDVVTARQPITEAWLRRLHEVLCASQETHEVVTAVGLQEQPLAKGQYKVLLNNPTNVDTGRVFHYAPVADTPPEMHRLAAELDGAGFKAAHPVVQAAYAHYAFVRIHPFADGNGRVARALASLFLYRAPGVPLVVFADQKNLYLDALEAADEGRPDAFVAFVAERAIDTIELVRTSLGRTGGASEALRRIRSDLAGRAGLSHTEYDALNQRLGDLLLERLGEVVRGLEFHEGVRLDVDRSAVGGEAPPEGYRAAQSATIDCYLRTTSPVSVNRQQRLGVWAAKPETEGADFIAIASGFARPLDIYLRDIRPRATEILRMKMDHWLQAILDRELEAFALDVHAALVRAGYKTEVRAALDDMVRVSEELGLYEATDGPPPPMR